VLHKCVLPTAGKCLQQKDEALVRAYHMAEHTVVPRNIQCRRV
jgi:hypothetical protein